MPHISMQMVKRINEIPLETIIDTLAGKEEWTGPPRERKRKCMFHREKTPSFSVSREKNQYHCFGCGTGGDAIKFMMQYRGLDFPDAARTLVSQFLPEVSLTQLFARPRKGSRPQQKEEVVKPFNLDSDRRDMLLGLVQQTQQYYQEQLQTNSGEIAKEARRYVASRGLDRVASQLGIGFAPANDINFMKLMAELTDEQYPLELLANNGLFGPSGYRVMSNRVTFPLATAQGAVLGFTARALHEDKKRAGKYKNTPQCETFSKGHVLYGMHLLDMDRVKGSTLYLVEGITDLAGFIEQSIPQAVALGSTALTDKHVGLIARMQPKEVVIMTDGDVAGARGAVINASRILGTHHVADDLTLSIVAFPLGKDPFDMFFYEGKDIVSYVQAQALPPSMFLLKNAELIERSFKHDTQFRNFVYNHAEFVVTPEFCKDRGIQDYTRKKKRFTYENPHGFLLKNK